MPFDISRYHKEFQYGGRPFSETGSSYISVVDWVILLKFGMQIDFHLLLLLPYITAPIAAAVV